MGKRLEFLFLIKDFSVACKSLKKKMYSHSVLGTLRYTERLMFSQNYPSTESSAGFNKYYGEKQFKCAWEILQGKAVF